jgi:hypothetical protein
MGVPHTCPLRRTLHGKFIMGTSLNTSTMPVSHLPQAWPASMGIEVAVIAHSIESPPRRMCGSRADLNCQIEDYFGGKKQLLTGFPHVADVISVRAARGPVVIQSWMWQAGSALGRVSTASSSA